VRLRTTFADTLIPNNAFAAGFLAPADGRPAWIRVKEDPLVASFEQDPLET